MTLALSQPHQWNNCSKPRTRETQKIRGLRVKCVYTGSVVGILPLGGNNPFTTNAKLLASTSINDKADHFIRVMEYLEYLEYLEYRDFLLLFTTPFIKTIIVRTGKIFTKCCCCWRRRRGGTKVTRYGSEFSLRFLPASAAAVCFV